MFIYEEFLQKIINNETMNYVKKGDENFKEKKKSENFKIEIKPQKLSEKQKEIER